MIKALWQNKELVMKENKPERATFEIAKIGAINN
jgi:hypothetical protein